MDSPWRKTERGAGGEPGLSPGFIYPSMPGVGSWCADFLPYMFGGNPKADLPIPLIIPVRRSKYPVDSGQELAVSSVCAYRTIQQHGLALIFLKMSFPREMWITPSQLWIRPEVSPYPQVLLHYAQRIGSSCNYL